MKYKLTKLQKQHLSSLEWLIDDSRAAGKTFLLAVVFIKKALEYRERWIYPFDHFKEGGAMAESVVMNEIKRIISQDKKILERAEFRQGAFRIN